MKKILTIIILAVFSLTLFWQIKNRGELIVSPLAIMPKKNTALSQYSFENLAKRRYTGSEIKLGRLLKNEQNYNSFIFYYQANGKKVSGLINLPKNDPLVDGFPVIVMIRGYVDQENYQTGVGTAKPAEYFANHGFITLAPDFIGYGESEPQLDPDILVDRFQKPVEILDLIGSIKNLASQGRALRSYFVNSEKIGIWGHSNGGQIGLSVLEISEKKYPTVLWAPVTLGFPESVVSFSSILDDNGQKVKTRIMDFLKDYDPKIFSIDNYFEKIKAPLQVHQGGWDDLIDINQTAKFVDKMKLLGKQVDYFIYPKSDHNLEPDWDLAAERNLKFFKENL